MTEPTLKNYGLLEEPVTEDQYVLGSSVLPFVELQPDGQWDAFLPAYECQERGLFDSMNCTNYGTINCLETLIRRLRGIEENFSERYTGVMTGTTPNGNSAHAVIEIIRNESGLIPEQVLPFSEEIDSWEEYYAPVPMEQKYIRTGKEFLRKNKIGHEWVFTGGNINAKQNLLKNALKTSPLGVSVRAWQENKQGLYYKEQGSADNHWCMLYGYEDGKYWKIYDHYDATFKKLAWDYDFGRAKRYSIEMTGATEQNNNGFWKKILEFFTNIFS